MSSKFSQPFLKKSPLLVGAYEAAADGMAFMGGVITGEKQFAKLNQDIIKGFDNYMEGEGTQQRLQKSSQDKINKMKINADESKGPIVTQKDIDSAQAAHDGRFRSSSKSSVCGSGKTLVQSVDEKTGEPKFKCE